MEKIVLDRWVRKAYREWNGTDRTASMIELKANHNQFGILSQKCISTLATVRSAVYVWHAFHVPIQYHNETDGVRAYVWTKHLLCVVSHSSSAMLNGSIYSVCHVCVSHVVCMFRPFRGCFISAILRKWNFIKKVRQAGPAHHPTTRNIA